MMDNDRLFSLNLLPTMNGNIISSTELNILAAAEKLFLEKGFKAASTTEIAREAGCNQALVHYYFRTKENLFDKIFYAKFETVMDFIDRSIRDDSNIFNSISSIIDEYFHFLTENPKIPYFLFNELTQNQERRKYIREVFLSSERGQTVFSRLQSMVERAIRTGTIREIDPLDLIIDGMSLVVFSFIAAPIFIDLLGRDGNTASEFLEHRKKEIITLLINGLMPVGTTAG